MRRNAHLREQARILRAEKHLALSAIAEALGVPKGTAYYWLKDIKIPKLVTEKQKLNQQRGTIAFQAKCASERKNVYDLAYENAREALRDSQIRDFVVLYLAEGFRRDRNRVSFSNSNPKMVAFAHSIMRRLATNPHFRYSFQFHTDQDPEALKAFWGAYLNIDPDIINPIPKTNSGHLQGRRFACEYGVFQIHIGDTRFRAQLQALMDALQEEWATGQT